MLADALMIFSLLREPLPYFRSYRNRFVAIYLAFLVFPTQVLVMILDAKDQVSLLLASQLLIIAAVIIATVWADTATRLYVYPDQFRAKQALLMLRRPMNSLYILYVGLMILTLIIGVGDPSSIDVNPRIMSFYLLDGSYYRAVAYSVEFLILAGILAVAFTFYPFLLLVRLRSKLKDPDVRYALKVIASCFGATSMLLLLSEALSSFGYTIIGLGNLGSMILLIAAVRAFRKPNFLKAFLGVTPSLDKSLFGTSSDQVAVIYSGGQEKFGPISRYTSEGVAKGELVVYLHPEDESALREELAKRGVNVRQYSLKGTLRFLPLTSLYPQESPLDSSAIFESFKEIATEARTLGREGLRVIIDFGDYQGNSLQKFVQHLTDAHWTDPSHYVHVLMALEESTFKGRENALAILRAKVPAMVLQENVDVFSRTLGSSHSELTGKKILFEYEPSSDYEKALSSILAEGASNFERLVVFSRKDSPLYSELGDQPGLKMFILTSRVSYPKIENENRVLIPAYDGSLLLDSLNKTIEALAGASFVIVFDSISHFIFTLGQERTYSLVRQALELMASSKITAVFLLNVSAHDPKTVSTLEGLFDMELLCRTGARAPELRKNLTVYAG
jgi:hypothetical protein